MGPHTARRPADRLSGAGRAGSAVGVARTAAVADRAAALLPASGRAGPSTSITVTVPCAELLVEAADDGRARAACSWVAQAVESVRTTSRAVGERSRACSAAATSAPTSSGQRAKTPCTRRSSSQPWSATSRPTVASSSCGSRSSGWAPDDRGRRRGRRPAAAALAARCAGRRAARWPGSAPGPGRGRRRWCGSVRLRRPAARAVVVSRHGSPPRRATTVAGARPAPRARRRPPPR